jgi:hypothetical protein
MAPYAKGMHPKECPWTLSARGLCLPRQYMLADTVSPHTISGVGDVPFAYCVPSVRHSITFTELDALQKLCGHNLLAA